MVGHPVWWEAIAAPVDTNVVIRLALGRFATYDEPPDPQGMSVVCDGTEVAGQWTVFPTERQEEWQWLEDGLGYFVPPDEMETRTFRYGVQFRPDTLLPPDADCDVNWGWWTMVQLHTGTAPRSPEPPSWPEGLQLQAMAYAVRDHECARPQPGSCTVCEYTHWDPGGWAAVLTFPLPSGWTMGRLPEKLALSSQVASSASALDEAPVTLDWGVIALSLAEDLGVIAVPLGERDSGPRCVRLWLEDEVGQPSTVLQQCFDPAQVDFDAVPTDPADPSETPHAAGCGCRTGGAPTGGGLLLVLLVGLVWHRRRRRGGVR